VLLAAFALLTSSTFVVVALDQPASAPLQVALTEPLNQAHVSTDMTSI
jgi:hypothetical protein